MIVNNDIIIATGYNGSPRGEENCCDTGKCPRMNKPNNSGDYSDCPAVHAEQNAMLSASRKDMIGSIMYLFGTEYLGLDNYPSMRRVIKKPEPCPICLRMLKNSGIEMVITTNGIVYERN